MKAMIKTFLALAFAAITPAAAQQSSSFFGPDGKFAGSAITRSSPQIPGGSSGSSTSFYGPNGNFTGSSTRVGNTTTFYGANGNYQGSVTQQGTASNPLTGQR
jgi:hypothetical protein